MMDPVALEQLKKSPCAPHFKKIGLYPHHGIVLMLSSLHSKNSIGIGGFLDLLPLIEWAHKLGLDFIQLLPLTDSGLDNSPYNPLSTLALNPTFLSLEALPNLSSNQELSDQLKKLQTAKQPEKVHYLKVRGQKLHFLQKYIELFGEAIEKEEGYQLFLEENGWVLDYALFNIFSERYQSYEWEKWPSPHKKLSTVTREKALKQEAQKIRFYSILQFFCSQQLKKVKKEAEKNHLFLFGDLPFLVSRHSQDAWSYPDLFLSHFSVGSPPDRLTPKGQNWDFPAYNWENLKKTEYHWWKIRLRVAENFFHIYRLDHIIGFYRTWNIPRGKEGRDGAFFPEDPSLWLSHGRAFLKTLLNYSKMLPIGEDLVIPQTVIDSMRDLGICGTRILTWQRTGSGGLDFVPYPLYSVASITHLATHDTSTLAQWWKKYPKTAKEFSQWKKWRYSPQLNKAQRLELLSDSHHTTSLFHANLLQEYLALFPDLVHNSLHKERINYPGTPSDKNWRYRFIPSVEELVKHRKLKDAFKQILA